MKFNIVHDLNVPAEKFWAHQFNPALEAAVGKAIHLSEYNVFENKDSGSLLLRKIHVVPEVELPGPLKKLLGGQTGYTQEDRVPKTGLQYEWSARPDVLSDKVLMGGTFRVDPTGPTSCRRTINGEITVKIFGVGALFEKFVISELEKNYAQVARAQEKWIQENA